MAASCAMRWGCDFSIIDDFTISYLYLNLARLFLVCWAVAAAAKACVCYLLYKVSRLEFKERGGRGGGRVNMISKVENGPSVVRLLAPATASSQMGYSEMGYSLRLLPLDSRWTAPAKQILSRSHSETESDSEGCCGLPAHDGS